MNKYLMISAAALLGSITGAPAAVDQKGSGVQSVYATATQSGTTVTFCDAVTFMWKGLNNQIIDRETGCGSGYTGVYGIGSGITGNTAKLGFNADDSDSIAAGNDAQFNLDFAVNKNGTPMNGGALTAYLTLITTSGTLQSFVLYKGHYHFGKPPHKGRHPAISAGAKQAVKSRLPLVSGLMVKR